MRNVPNPVLDRKPRPCMSGGAEGKHQFTCDHVACSEQRTPVKSSAGNVETNTMLAVQYPEPCSRGVEGGKTPVNLPATTACSEVPNR